jgi:transposase-like protein
MEVIPDFAGATVRDFVTRNITVGTTVYTDGLKSFYELTAAGYKHVPRSQPPQRRLRLGAKSVVPLADRMIGNLQNWLVGTHHGVSRGQLQVYLDEFVFRTNRRREPRAAFQTLLGLGSGRGPTNYEQIRHGRDRKLLGLAETTG